MNISRRSFLLSYLAAPVVVRAGSLMPIFAPRLELIEEVVAYDIMQDEMAHALQWMAPNGNAFYRWSRYDQTHLAKARRYYGVEPLRLKIQIESRQLRAWEAQIKCPT